MAGNGNNNDNDLNMILKAKVVKLKVELDAKGSKLPAQVDAISKMLAKHSVKLKVELKTSPTDLNKQVKEIGKIIKKADNFKPLIIDVELDVKGSSKVVKKQMKELIDIIHEFNKTYAKEIERMGKIKPQQPTPNQPQKPKPLDIKTNIDVQGINNIKDYTKQLEIAERKLRAKLKDGESGIFSSREMKDQAGNLRGFIAMLEKANGVTEKIKYQWDKERDKFLVIDRTTLNANQKNTARAIDSLKELQTGLKDTGKQSKEFSKQYSQLMKNGEDGTLTTEMVKNFKERVKLAKAENLEVQKSKTLLREQAKAIREIKNIAKGTGGAFSSDAKDLTFKVNKAKTVADLKDVRLAMNEFTDKVKEHKRQEQELIKVEKPKQQMQKELTRLLRESAGTIDTLSEKEIKRVRSIVSQVRTTEQLNEAQKKLNALQRAETTYKDQSAREKGMIRLKNAMIELAKVTGKDASTIESRFKQMQKNVSGSVSMIESEISRINKSIAKANQKAQIDTLNLMEKSIISTNKSTGKQFNHAEMRSLVNEGDVTKIKEYLAVTQKLDIATAKIATNRKGITTITTTLASTGKTAKQVTYEIDRLTNKLRFMGQQDVFNRNANLGIFEQLKVAMQRVPVWMASMTAFYGSIEVVRSMTNEILKLDSAMTELRRVASDSLNIDSVFSGAIQMSKELGNNVHDVMQSVNDMARTFGDFNERQLLAISRTAVLMSNVSDLSAQDAAENLVGTMNAFNITAEESIRIVDSLNEVDNNYAISTQQLATGLSKSASTARTFGVSLEENVGHITAIGAVTMESGNIIGNSLKTIYSRITTMGGVRTVLEQVGVSLYTIGKNGEEKVKPVNDILEDLGSKWSGLSDSQRQNIAVQVAGRYQLSRFLALMNNWDMALESTNTAVYSQGSAMRENAERMKSFEARINTLKNSWTELSSAVGDAILSAGMMEIIRLFTSLANGAVEVVKTVGALPVVFGALYPIASKMGFFDKVKDMIGGSAVELKRFGDTYKREMASGNVSRVGAMATAWKGVTIAEAEASAGAKAFGWSLKGALISTGVGALIVGIGIAIEKLIGWYNKKKLKEEELTKMNKKMVDSYRSHSDGMDALVAKYEDLTGKAKLTADEQRELEGVTKSLAEQIPTTVKYVDANGKAHLKTTEEIKREIDAVKKLSETQAKITELNFAKKLEKQAESFDKIITKIDDLNKKQKELQEANGKSSMFATLQDEVNGFSIDNREAIERNKIDIMMAEADKTKAIQTTVKAIQDQTLAYFEARGKLGELGEEQRKVIENFVAYNESSLRFAKTPEQYKKAYQDLFMMGKQAGDMFIVAYEKLSKGVEDPLELQAIRTDLDDVAKSLPKTFYEMTDGMGRVKKSSKEMQEGIREAINVSYQVRNGNGNWEQLAKKLREAGLSANEADGYLKKLAEQHNNAKLKAEAQERKVKDLKDTTDEYVDSALEAVDVTKELFGYGSDELKGIETNAQTLAIKLQKAKDKDAFRQTDEYKELSSGIMDATKYTTPEQVEKNLVKIVTESQLLQGINWSDYDGGDYKKFIDAQEDLTDAEKEMLKNSDLTKNFFSGVEISVEKASKKMKEGAEQNKKYDKSQEDLISKKDVPKNPVVDYVDQAKNATKNTGWITGFKKVLDNALMSNPLTFQFSGIANKGRNSLFAEIGGMFKGLGGKIKEWASGNETVQGIADAGRNVGDYFKTKFMPAVKGGISSSWGDVKGAFTGMGSAIANWVTKDGSWQKTAYDSIYNFGAKVGTFFKELPSKISLSAGEFGLSVGNFFSHLITDSAKWFTDATNATITFFQELPKKAQEAGGYKELIGQWLADAIPATLEKLGEWWNAFATWMSGVPSLIVQKLGEWKKALTDFTLEQHEENKKAWNDFTTWLGTWYDSTREKILGKLGEWGTSISGYFTNYFQNDLPKAFGNVIGNAVGIYFWFDSVKEGIVKKIGEWLGAIGNTFVDIWKSTATGFTTWWGNISNWFTTKKNDVITKCGEWLSAIGATFTDIWTRTSTGFTNWWNSVSTWFTTKKAELGTKAGEWLEATTSWVKNLPQNTAQGFENWKTSIANWFTNARTNWKTGLANWFSEVKTWTTNLPQRTKDGFDKWSVNIGTWFTNTKTKWSEGLGKWWTTTSTWFKTLPSRTKEGFENWKSSIGTWFTNTKSKWKEGLENWGTEVKNWFKKLPEKKEVKEAGSKTIEKVGDGIKSKKPDTLKKLSSTIVDSLQQIASMAFVLTLAVGREIIVRMIKGIADKVPALWKKWNEIKSYPIRKLIELAGEAYKWAKDIVIRLGKGIGEKSKIFIDKFVDLKNSAMKKLGELKDSAVAWAKSLPKTMGDTMSKYKNGAINGVISLVNGIGDKLETGVNDYLIKGINKALKFMGVKDGVDKIKIPNIKAYAKGTMQKRHDGGMALVGEEGRELAHIPNRGLTMLGVNAPEIRNLPRGTSVLPHAQTEQVMQKYNFPKSAMKNMPAYASGVGDFFDSLWDKPKDLMEKIWGDTKDALSFSDGFVGDVARYGVKQIKDTAIDFVGNKLNEWMPAFDGADGGDSSKIGAGAGKGGMHKYVEYWYNQVKSRFGKTHFMGGYNNRNVRGGNSKSMHAYGRAFDIGGSHETMSKIAEWLRLNASNVQYVIYNRRISSKGGAWRHYGGVNPHTDHVHADFLSQGGGGGGKMGKSGSSAQAWKPQILRASAQMNEPVSAKQLQGIIAQIHRESKGNQNIVQSSAVRDINTRNGNPAKGLLQYIPQTFRAYAMRGHSNIFSGYDQLLAFFNNTTWKKDLPYGRSGWSPRGSRKYAKGGLIDRPHFGLVGEAGREYIIPVQNNKKEGFALWQEAGKELGVIPYAKGGTVGKKTTSTKKLSYTVQEGNTLAGIAKLFKTSVENLKKINKGLEKTSKDKKLTAGMKVNVTGLIKDDDSFRSNDLLDKNRKKKGYKQAEDGTWVKYTPPKNNSTKTPSKSTTKTPEKTSTASSSVLKRGSKGEDVKALQKKLGIKADGIYGAQTEQAVKAYQKKNGLAVDGIVGSKTMAKMGIKSSGGSSSSGGSKTSYDTNKTIIGGLDRQQGVVTDRIELLNAQMADMDKNSLKYRDALKKQGEATVELLALQKKDLIQTEAKQKDIEKKLKGYGDPSKLTGEKLEEYNQLQQDYDATLDKVNGLKVSVEGSLDAIAQKALEVFTSYIGEITTKYDAYIDGYDKRIDDVQFAMDVRSIVNPDDMKWTLNNQIDIANLSKQKQATVYNKKNSMEIQHTNAVKKYGYHSDQAKAVRAELEASREAYEQATLEVLNAEKAIKDTRGKVADDGINQLKEYYNAMKSMSLDAIDKQKEALQKAHDAEMKIYDEKIEKINELYDATIKDMDAKKSEDEYEKGLEEKNTKKSELTNKIALLSRDTTTSGKKKVADLQKELDELNKDIAEYQADRQDTLLRQSLTDQKDAQIEAINQTKEQKQETLNGQLADLDAEKEAITAKYDALINDETRWANIRNEAIKGNFTLLNTELGTMQTTLNNLNKGIFDGLTAGFKNYSQAVQDEIKKANELAVDNMNYSAKDPVSNAKEASEAKKYDANSDGTVKTKGDKVDDPKKTTPPPAPKPAPTTPPKSGSGSGSTTPPKGSNGSSSGKFTETLKTGSKGENVKLLQKKLGIKADGVFGKDTYNALIKWQKANGLPADGIAGKSTLTKMGLYGSSSTKTPTTPTTSNSSDRKITSAVSFRSSAGYGNNVIQTIAKGAKVQYLGIEKGWAKIKYNGKTGYVGEQFLQKFKTGGYTGDWTGDDGKLAILHKKELVLNERQTSDILDTAKILGEVKRPILNRKNLAKDFIAEGGVNITNNYELTVNIENMNGSKEQSQSVAKEIMTGLKKMGRK